MLKTLLGSENGYEVKTYRESNVYEIPFRLFEGFKDKGGVEIFEEKAIDTYENKMMDIKVVKKRGRPKKQE